MMNNEILEKERYLQGATSMLGLLRRVGMPPEFLDELEEMFHWVEMKLLMK